MTEERLRRITLVLAEAICLIQMAESDVYDDDYEKAAWRLAAALPMLQNAKDGLELN